LVLQLKLQPQTLKRRLIYILKMSLHEKITKKWRKNCNRTFSQKRNTYRYLKIETDVTDVTIETIETVETVMTIFKNNYLLL